MYPNPQQTGISFAQIRGSLVVWPPLKKKKADRERLPGLAAQWLKDPMDVELDFASVGKLEAFVVACAFTVALCRAALIRISERASVDARSFARHPPGYASEVGMSEVEADQLKEAIERMHGGAAALARSIPVRETFEGKTVWEGAVHVFDLTGHPIAARAYAWSSPIEGSTKRRFFAVLHEPPVDSPQAAVRVAIVAENKGKAKCK